MNRLEPSDLELLRAWAQGRDREAIGELIRRHIDFVHALARRRVGGDGHLADDVTQAVFILLLRKAHRIKSEAAMTSWLCTTTRYAAGNAIKMLKRRKRYEERGVEVSAMNQSESQPDVVAENLELGPVLDEAMDQLTKTDRLCVVMSYLQQKTHGQVAAAVGLSQDATRKRISRSIERMREYLASRGTIVPSATVAAALAVKPTGVSAAFFQSTLNIAILSHSAEGVGTAAAIAKGVSQMIFATKMKVAAVLAVGLMITGFATAQAVKIFSQSAVGPVAQQVAAPAQPQNPNVVVDKNVADLGDGVLVEFVGVSSIKQNEWHDISGQPINTPELPPKNATWAHPPQYRAMVRITCPDDADADVVMGNALVRGGGGGNKGRLLEFDPKPGATSIDITVEVADGAWKTVLDEKPWRGLITESAQVKTTDPVIEASLSPIIDHKGKTMIYASIFSEIYPMRFVCRGADGREYVGQPESGMVSTSKTSLADYVFDLPSNKISRVQVQTRQYTKHVTAKNVCLDANSPTQAKIEVGN